MMRGLVMPVINRPWATAKTSSPEAQRQQVLHSLESLELQQILERSNRRMQALPEDVLQRVVLNARIHHLSDATGLPLHVHIIQQLNRLPGAERLVSKFLRGLRHAVLNRPAPD